MKKMVDYLIPNAQRKPKKTYKIKGDVYDV